jgi:hypothetical protein
LTNNINQYTLGVNKMMITKLWRKRVLVVGTMVLILSLFALNLNALLFQGRAEVSQAKALPIFLPLKAEFIPPYSYYCTPWGMTCIIILAENGVQQKITLV